MLKMLTYNIHKGKRLRSNELILERLRERIRHVDADLVFLQEVVGSDVRESRDGGSQTVEAQLEFLADELWPHYSYGRNAVYDSGHHGNALISKHPIAQQRNIDISTSHALEKRGLLHAKIELTSRERHLDCFCTHLGLSIWERRKQFRQISKKISRLVDSRAPFILAGDFNDWLCVGGPLLSSTLQAEEFYYCLHRRRPKTFPSFWPILSIDRIYGRGVKVVNAEVLDDKAWRSLSDHLPLYVEVETSTDEQP